MCVNLDQVPTAMFNKRVFVLICLIDKRRGYGNVSLCDVTKAEL